MSRGSAQCLLLCAVLASSSSGFAEAHSNPRAEPGSQLTVWVYNHARVRKPRLTRATSTARRIFRRAGVETTWRTGPLSQEEVENGALSGTQLGATALALRILSRSMTTRLAVPSDCFGFAQMSGAVRFPTVANILFHRIGQLAGDRIADAAVILGHMLAHEIGHLLLTDRGHSRTGIMSAPWRREHLKLVAHEQLLFTRRQAEKMRANVQKRSEH